MWWHAESVVMKIVETSILLSASDLSTPISCHHATFLNLQLAKKIIPPPPVYDNPSLEASQKKGEEFEDSYIKQLKESGCTVV